MDDHSCLLSLFFPLIKFKKEAVFSLSQSGEGSKRKEEAENRKSEWKESERRGSKKKQCV